MRKENEVVTVTTPCGFGDKVYCIFESRIYEGIAMNFNFFIGCLTDHCNIDVSFDIPDPFYRDGRMRNMVQPKRFGETVFIDEESAEKALEKLKLQTETGTQKNAEKRGNNMDYKRLADLIRQFANIELLACEVESLDDTQEVETIDELADFLSDELELSCQ